jgi:hypothetical protein
MTEAPQYSKEILLENLQKLSQCADNSIRATIEQNLLSMTGHPDYLADTFQIITSATNQGTYFSTPINLSTPIFLSLPNNNKFSLTEKNLPRKLVHNWANWFE